MAELSIENQLQPQGFLSSKNRWLHFLLLGVLTVFSYGMALNRLGFYWDDVGVVFSKYFYGDKGLMEYASRDRFFAKYLYGSIPRIIGLASWRWHVFGILVWWFNACLYFVFVGRLFKNMPKLAVWASLFFVVFPTFGSMFISIIYSMGFFSLIWLLLSFIFMDNYLQGKNKVASLILSLVFMLLEILQSEYWIGIEFFRVVIILIMISGSASVRQLLKKDQIIAAIKKYLPYLAVLLVFVIWRLFIFKGYRASTDAGSVMHELAKNPVQGFFFKAQKPVF